MGLDFPSEDITARIAKRKRDQEYAASQEGVPEGYVRVISAPGPYGVTSSRLVKSEVIEAARVAREAGAAKAARKSALLFYGQGQRTARRTT